MQRFQNFPKFTQLTSDARDRRNTGNMLVAA